MTRYDNEKTIISDFQELDSCEILLLNNMLKTRAICNAIHNPKKWTQWIDSSSKKDPPPDFYNPNLKLMMDVMRIDDHAYEDENGKIINPYTQRESKIVNEFIRKDDLMREKAKQGHLIIIPHTGLESEKDHNYIFYINSFKRVVGNHIKNINNYKKNHPSFKVIFFVLDESSPYAKTFDGHRFKKVGEKHYAHPHLWWYDKNMIDCLLASNIDYLIWMTPCKHFDSEEGIEFPSATIIDVKKIDYSKLIEYDPSEMQSLEK